MKKKSPAVFVISALRINYVAFQIYWHSVLIAFVVILRSLIFISQVYSCDLEVILFTRPGFVYKKLVRLFIMSFGSHYSHRQTADNKINSNLKSDKTKKSYDGLYVTNLEDFDNDIFTLDQPGTVSKTKDSKPLLPATRATTKSMDNDKDTRISKVKEDCVSGNKPGHVPSTINNSSNKFSHSPTMKGGGQLPENDVKARSVITPKTQRATATPTNAVKRPSASKIKMDVKGFGHDTEDLVIQNLDEDFWAFGIWVLCVQMRLTQITVCDVCTYISMSRYFTD